MERGQYNLQEWAQQIEAGKRIFIWNFFMAGKEIQGWRLLKTIPEQIYEDRRILTYLWQRVEKDAEELIKIEIIESANWHRAHETLVELLGEHQALQIPEAKSKKVELGDIAFVGFGDMIQSVIFTRANLVIRINSIGRKNVSIINESNQMDSLFISKPKPSEKGVIPEIERFSSERELAKINETVALNIKARDPLDRNVWYKFTVNQGEIFVKDKKICFLSEIPGASEINLFVTNENGFVSKADLRINVEK
jgi:hypothetical protein